ncbi:uncharacterized protein BX664DRAFT_376531 [Halteromyces radiatus]|uniref:uncharacterized protein n=1 Tax=Halteromyces radiatus TaxID=101107 RepID=UPI00222048E1|nr:uncharacterized protein BX664DRAFT_376531 [Halteromyces radiatus]KAI8079728.1 hypothetical protein BX664DRAFT_376531 [Halteromyces radiatus]
MKSLQLTLNSERRFDNDYSNDIQEKWTQNDFCSILDVFHNAVNTNPPPRSAWLWFFILMICWVLECAIVFVLVPSISWVKYIVLPIIMYATAFLVTWRHRVIRNKFESFITDLCDRFNATENIRGIHYHFQCHSPPWYYLWRRTHYTLSIDLDDRYQALTAKSYSQTTDDDQSYCVAIPDVAHVPQKLDPWDEKTQMFKDYH